MISRPRVERTPITFATDVTDRGVSPHPCSTLFVISLVMSSDLVALRLVLGLAWVAAHWLGCECPTGQTWAGDGWHGLGVGVGVWVLVVVV